MKTPHFASAIILISDTPELVRGCEQPFLQQLMPRVRKESVALDLASVERIDAAGLAALVTVYSEACKAGHHFTVSRPSRHVRQILALVGLDRLLIAQHDPEPSIDELQLQESAA